MTHRSLTMTGNKLLIALVSGLFATGAFAQTSNGNSSNAESAPTASPMQGTDADGKKIEEDAHEQGFVDGQIGELAQDAGRHRRRERSRGKRPVQVRQGRSAADGTQRRQALPPFA